MSLQQQQQHQQKSNQFDRLPDAVVRLIFNKLRDAKSLCQSTLVCKRFASIAPQADTVFLSVPRKSIFTKQSLHHHHHHITESVHRHGSKKLFKSLIRKLITRPLRFLLRFRSSTCYDDYYCSYHSPHHILRNFEEIQSLRVELPGYGGGDVQSNGGDSLLKWRAEFGSDLQSCVILGAKSFYTSSQVRNHSEENDEEEQRQSDEDLLLTGDDLKLRVVWTISCLIAASERHYFLHRIVSEHPTIQSLLATDTSNQGRLRMSREQIEELRSQVNSSAKLEKPAASESERTPVPALKMKLWYAPALELPAFGRGMKGATLVVIRPVEGAKNAESDGDLVARVFNGLDEGGDDERVIGEAATELMNKNNTYTLEMNAF